MLPILLKTNNYFEKTDLVFQTGSIDPQGHGSRVIKEEEEEIGERERMMLDLKDELKLM